MKKTKLKGKAILALLPLTLLASCGNLNNARLAIGGDAIEIDAYRESVAPGYEAMGKNRHFSLSASEASIKIKGNFEKRIADVTTSYVVDMELSNISFESAFIYASDYVPTEEDSQSSGEEIDTTQKGALSISYDGYLSYQEGSYSYLEQNGSHALKASLEGDSLTTIEGNHDVYERIFSLPLFPNSLSLSSLYKRLLFLESGNPLITQNILNDTNNKLVQSAASFRALEQEVAYTDEILTVSSFGDNVFGLGVYMDRADYSSFFSAFKTHYLENGTEEGYMSAYGNFYDKLEMNRLAISQVNNANGLVDFGVNIDCSLKSMDNYVYCDDGGFLKVSDLEIDVEIMYNFSQGDGIIDTYNNLMALDTVVDSESSSGSSL